MTLYCLFLSVTSTLLRCRRSRLWNHLMNQVVLQVQVNMLLCRRSMPVLFTMLSGRLECSMYFSLLKLRSRYFKLNANFRKSGERFSIWFPVKISFWRDLVQFESTMGTLVRRFPLRSKILNKVNFSISSQKNLVNTFFLMYRSDSPSGRLWSTSRGMKLGLSSEMSSMRVCCWHTGQTQSKSSPECGNNVS